MTLSKVKSCKGAGDWSNEHGTFYKFKYTMEDGKTLTASHKKQEGFPIGADVDYEIKGTNDHGSYGSVKKPDTSNYSVSNTSNGGSGSNRSFALSYAKDVLIASYMTPKTDVLSLSTDQMFDLAKKMNSWLDNKEAEQTATEQLMDDSQN